MPFDPNNPPSKLDKLSDKKKRQWVHVFNSCYKKNKDDKKCHMQAWGAVKKSASRMPTASERILKEIRSITKIIETAHVARRRRLSSLQRR
jgi:hypothetical protein